MLFFLALLAASPVPTESRQLLLSVASGWDTPAATVRLYERRDARAPWRSSGGPMPASLGRAGLAWGRGLHPSGLAGPDKREGDGRAPAGVFALRQATGYAAQPLAGTRLMYRQATAALRCVDDPASKHYNTLVDEDVIRKDWSSAEDMRRSDELYRWVIWVGHNDEPAVPGAGSCIFLHQRRAVDAATAGCTAFDPDSIQRLLVALDPRARPVLVQLPQTELVARRADWGLPD